MPQMAPMMWQMMYVMCTLLLMVMMCKNFFLTIKMDNSTTEMKVSKKEMNWQW